MSKNRSRKPYTIAGAGPLTATIWKTGDEVAGWRYEFNIVRTIAANGRVTQRFRPRDVIDLTKLAQVLAFTLADDGCLDPDLRERLNWLAENLRKVLSHRIARHTKR